MFMNANCIQAQIIKVIKVAKAFCFSNDHGEIVNKE